MNLAVDHVQPVVPALKRRSDLDRLGAVARDGANVAYLALTPTALAMSMLSL
jgi:hypothetical protein